MVDWWVGALSPACLSTMKEKNMNKEMTDKQKAVYTYIKLSIKSNNHQPSLQEMADYFSISMPAVTHRLILLEKKGYIRRTGKARAIEIIEK